MGNIVIISQVSAFKPLDDVILPSISSYRHMVTSPWGPLLVSRDHGGGLEHRAWHLHTLCPNCQAEDGGAIGDVASRLWGAGGGWRCWSGWRWLECGGEVADIWRAAPRTISETPAALHGAAPTPWILNSRYPRDSTQVAMATRQMLEISDSSWKEYRSSKEAETIFEPYCFPSLPSQQYSPLLQVWKFSEICQSWVSGYENVYLYSYQLSSVVLLRWQLCHDVTICQEIT